jgi:hypothetical protein
MDAAGVRHAIVRTLVNGAWRLVDDVAGAINRCYMPDSNGYSYAGGQVFNTKHWVMRDPPPQPTTAPHDKERDPRRTFDLIEALSRGGKVDAIEWLEKPVMDALPSLPRCDYLAY